MKILFLTDNFPPERNAPASRTYEHALEWIAAGHEVTVITTAPNFPEGKLFDGYRNRLYSSEMMNGIRVVRVVSFISPNSGIIKRTADYLSFMISGGLAALFQTKPDVLVTTSPQYFCAVAGWVVSRLRGLPWVFELRDLWPASIVTLGAMRRGWAIRALEWLELRMYRDANSVVVVSNAFTKNLVSRGIPASKIELVLNGVDLKRYQPQPKDPGLLKSFDLEGRFVVGYLGTHGMAHALEKVIDTAEILRDRDDIVFLFAGAGARRADLEAMVIQRKLTNVHMVPAQPKEMMAKLWSVHDVALIPLANHKLFESVIPSKMFEAIGMGIPILMSIPEGEATGLVRETGSGVCVPPENPQALADAILTLKSDPGLQKQLVAAALAAAPRFDRSNQASLMLSILKRVASQKETSKSIGVLPSG